MISPIGSFLSRFDANIQTAMTAGITGLTAYMAAPVMTSLAIYYLIQGVKIAQGDGAPVQHFVTQLFRNVTILWFCSNANTYNTWVMNIFFTGIPNALNKAILANATVGVGTANVGTGVTGTAAAFDQIWDLMNIMVANVTAHADFWDISTKLSAQLTGLTGGLALVVIAMVYLMSRFILAIVIELGVIAIACLIFDATKPIFERWLGKVIALVFLQVTAIVVLQIIIATDVEYMKQISAAYTDAGGVAAEIQGLVSMVVLFLMGAFAIYSLPAIAYSIGTGVAITTLPALYAAVKATQLAHSLLSKLEVSAPAAGAAEGGLALGLPQAELAGSSYGSISAPSAAALPPPPLSLPGY